MKIKISEALEHIVSDGEVSTNNLLGVKVELSKYSTGDDPVIQWSIYGYDIQSGKNVWSASFETFEEAYANLLEKFEEHRKPKTNFVE